MRSIRDEYDDGEWSDESSPGAGYEVQLNQRSGQWRYRPLNVGANAGVREEWRAGLPPKAKYNG